MMHDESREDLHSGAGPAKISRRMITSVLLIGGLGLAACGRKPNSLLPPSGAEGEEDDFPATYPRY